MSEVVYTLEEFNKFKPLNSEIPDDLKQYVLSIKSKVKFYRNKYMGNWNNKKKVNWILQKKVNETDDEKLYSKFQGILNKLSNDNYDELLDLLLHLDITKEEHLTKLIDIIFNKAIKESKFCEIYASLSVKLSGCYIINSEEKKVYFREILLNKCQNIFETISSLNDENHMVESGFKFKEDVFGCMNFIGELYNHELLTDKIMQSCLIMLLKQIAHNKFLVIYSLSTLFNTVAKVFCKKSPSAANLIYTKLELLKKSKEIKIKEKFAIKDVLERIKKDNIL